MSKVVSSFIRGVLDNKTNGTVSAPIDVSLHEVEIPLFLIHFEGFLSIHNSSDSVLKLIIHKKKSAHQNNDVYP